MKALLGAALVLGLASAGSVSASTVVGGDVTVPVNGTVVATYLGTAAGYSSVVGYMNGTTPVDLYETQGWSFPAIDLGTYYGGTVLSFFLRVLDWDGNLNTYYTGDATGNPDGTAHASVSTVGNVITIGFEDAFGGGDHDYNDAVFQLTVTPSAVPVPAAGLMLLSGLGAVAALRRRRQG